MRTHTAGAFSAAHPLTSSAQTLHFNIVPFYSILRMFMCAAIFSPPNQRWRRRYFAGIGMNFFLSCGWWLMTGCAAAKMVTTMQIENDFLAFIQPYTIRRVSTWICLCALSRTVPQRSPMSHQIFKTLTRIDWEVNFLWSYFDRVVAEYWVSRLCARCGCAVARHWMRK